jgi:hypothetical protein
MRVVTYTNDTMTVNKWVKVAFPFTWVAIFSEDT